MVWSENRELQDRLARRIDSRWTNHEDLRVREDWALGYRQVHIGRELNRKYRAHEKAYKDGRAAGLQDLQLQTRTRVGKLRLAYVRAGRAARAAGLLVTECKYIAGWQRELWREGWHAEQDPHPDFIPAFEWDEEEDGGM